MIKPEIGMPVVYHQHGDDHYPGPRQLAALITRVWGDGMVNLTIFDGNGLAQSRTSVMLWQGADGEPAPQGGRWCAFPTWFRMVAAPRKCARCDVPEPFVIPSLPFQVSHLDLVPHAIHVLPAAGAVPAGTPDNVQGCQPTSQVNG